MDVFGATSAGEFTDGHESQEASVILLLDISRVHYRLSFHATKNKDVTTIAKKATQDAMQIFSNPAFLLGTTCLSAAGEMYAGGAVIHSIQDTAGKAAIRLPAFPAKITNPSLRILSSPADSQ